MMTEDRRYGLNAQLDIDQILSEAQHRWLRPAEICEILQNYKNFQISQEPPNRPPGGSLFLFDRKVLRYFRKDGHNWRKKRDGKTVKEAHEKLKAGSVDVLHCYYAHGEEDECFQRRSYWLLEEELSHIVLVHYREVKGNRSNFSRLRDSDGIPRSQKIDDNVSFSDVGSSGASRVPSYDYQGTSQVTDTNSLSSIQASEHEDAESAYRHQASPGLYPVQGSPSLPSQMVEVGSVPYYTVPTSSSFEGHNLTIHGMSFGSTKEEKNTNIDNGLPYQFQQEQTFQSWEKVSERTTTSYQSVNFQSSFPSTKSSASSTLAGHGNELLDQVVTGLFGQRQEVGSHSQLSEEQQSSDGDSLHLSNWSMGQNSDLNENLGQNHYYPTLSRPLVYQNTKQNDVNQGHLSSAIGLQNTYVTEQSRLLLQDDLQLQNSNAVGNLSAEDKTKYPPLKPPQLDGIRRDGLQKLDSFDRWISKELDDVTSETIHPTSSVYWETVGNVDGDGSDVPLDNYALSPSISNDQLFTIENFSPNWAFSGTEIKVLVMGRFMKNHEELQSITWACMFGELEVPAEIVANGVLQCYTPSHEDGRVPFYVTCSNRLSCSEVREFEFRPIQDTDVVDAGSIVYDEALLYMRFRKLLSLEPSTSQTSVEGSSAETSQLCSINAVPKNELKEKLHIWLLQKLSEGGKGPSVLDEGGLGVLHFAAALGYDWAIAPIINEGVNINFRDANGWTALHWAAFHGRERMVGLLISLGAAPGFVTDPTPKYPSGRSPDELAAANGHKGIAGYLAESSLSSLSSHLSSVTLDGSHGSNQGTSVTRVSEQDVGYDDLPQGQSMKHSLSAVRNAVQAVSRIQQAYRVQSFQRKQLKEYGNHEFGISDDRALSLLALRTRKPGHHVEPINAAAVRIQNKFRSYKSRKDYLLIRQQIIKIQAHVRGHQVRKNYRKIIWSVGLLDKIILRWRRKGRGLSGFKPEAHAATSSPLTDAQEDEYEYLKEGRKQTEVKLEKALARVKSMAQYPEARDQYHRVMNVVSEMQEKKVAYDNILNNPEVDFDDALFDIDALLDDDGDTFM